MTVFIDSVSVYHASYGCCRFKVDIFSVHYACGNHEVRPWYAFFI